MSLTDYPKPPGWRHIGRHYLVNTCPVSRHTRMLADELRDPKSPIRKLFDDAGYEADHWASSLEWTVKSLWEARERIKKLDPVGEQRRAAAILQKALKKSAAQGTEARRAETVKHGSVHDGPVAKPCAHNPPSQEP